MLINNYHGGPHFRKISAMLQKIMDPSPSFSKVVNSLDTEISNCEKNLRRLRYRSFDIGSASVLTNFLMVGSTYSYIFNRLFKVGGGGHTLFIFYLYTNFDFCAIFGS